MNFKADQAGEKNENRCCKAHRSWRPENQCLAVTRRYFHAQVEAMHKRMVTFLALQLTKPDAGETGSPTSELIIKVVNLVVRLQMLPLQSIEVHVARVACINTRCWHMRMMHDLIAAPSTLCPSAIFAVCRHNVPAMVMLHGDAQTQRLTCCLRFCPVEFNLTRLDVFYSHLECNTFDCFTSCPSSDLQCYKKMDLQIFELLT